MSNKKQTAVEWLEKELQKEEYIEKIGCVTYIINQAKEMEKQQIIDFADNYGFDVCGYDYDNAEEYYNKTFKNK
jgi:hypothetical protein